MRFRAEQHLRRSLDFQHVRTHGRRHDCGAFVLWYVRQARPGDTADAPAPEGSAPSSIPARIGFVASRSSVGNAVQRARAKRRLRETFRGHQILVPAGYDLMLVARGSLNRLEYREIEQRFVAACRKIFPTAQA